MKIQLDESLTGKARYDFLVQNKTELIQQKKSSIKTTDAISYCPEYFMLGADKTATKTSIGEIPVDATKVRAKFVGNSAMWFDSQADVLLSDCWKKTIKDGQGRLHLKDHTYKMEAEVGDIVNIYSQNISLSELGLKQSGTTQALVFESDVQKSYDEKIFNKYKSGKVNQHSIGLRYGSILMAIDNEDYKEEFAVWNQYINQVINREDAEKAGFMWIIPEIKLIEVSCVLLGANQLTPTLEVGKSTVIQPVKTTDEQPQEAPLFDWGKAMSETTFVTI